MSTLFTLLYLFFLFLLCLGAIFVLYHLLRYSLNKTLGFMGVLFFSIIFSVLLITNISTFRQINFPKSFGPLQKQDLLPQSKFAPPLSNKSNSNPW